MFSTKHLIRFYLIKYLFIPILYLSKLMIAAVYSTQKTCIIFERKKNEGEDRSMIIHHHQSLRYQSRVDSNSNLCSRSNCVTLNTTCFCSLNIYIY